MVSLALAPPLSLLTCFRRVASVDRPDKRNIMIFCGFCVSTCVTSIYYICKCQWNGRLLLSVEICLQREKRWLRIMCSDIGRKQQSKTTSIVFLLFVLLVFFCPLLLWRTSRMHSTLLVTDYYYGYFRARSMSVYEKWSFLIEKIRRFVWCYWKWKIRF